MEYVKILVVCFYFTCCNLSFGHTRSSGNFTRIQNFPSQVTIEVDKIPICSGGIIGDQWVLTAGTCIIGNGTEVDRVRIRAGTSILSQGGAYHKVSKMVKLVPGGSSFFRTKDANLGLIKVTSPFTYASTIKWSSPGVDFLPDDADIVVSGWSIHKGSSEKLLQKASVRTIPHEQCSELYAGLVNVTSEMVCLVPATVNDEACIGDVGAPISVEGLLTAVVADNEYCWTKGLPLLVTNIGRFGFFIVITLSEPIFRFMPV